MKITVHSGIARFGGCVTEYESNGWKLFVDYGKQFPGATASDKALDIEGLTYGDLRKSALLITHFHGDNIDKIADLPAELPIYMEKISKEIAQELSEHLIPIDEKHSFLAKRLDSVKTFVPGEQFSFGEFNIIPIVSDNSAFESYAFRIEAKRLIVFHSGNFFTNGFRNGKLSKDIECCVGDIDYVVCEATNVNHTTISGVLDMLKPKAIIPIHTDNPHHFAELFCEKWPVILLEDGESFAAIHDPGFDTTTAVVMAFQKPDNSFEVIENPENLQWWMVDKKFLGEFQWWNDADSALHHVVYAPNRLLGYEIESDEDMAPFLYVVYNPDFTEHSKYEEGGHNPEEYNHIDCGFTPGQRVLAVIDEVIVPCEVVGPLTVDFLKKEYHDFGYCGENNFQEYKSELWDWDWDKVIVRPLVKIKTEYGEISSETTAQRIYIFPYKTLSTNEDTSSL